jgi:3-hydroxyisobutyrate dehydrogenase-like beta-hydroxyacid dehydrogenase
MSLMEKDIDLALEAAEHAGVELPLTGELKGHLHAASDAGFADDDFIALFQFLRRRAQLDQEVVP